MPTKIKDESPLELTADQMEQGGAALSGAAKGAMLGAKLGTIVPGIGNVVGAAAGGLIGGVGSLIKTKKQQEEEKPKYTTNIDPMTGQEIPLNMEKENKDTPMMMKPFKALTPYTASYSAYNMSAKQAKREEQMKQVSGADSALQANAFYAALNDAKEKGADTFKVGNKTFNVK